MSTTISTSELERLRKIFDDTEKYIELPNGCRIAKEFLSFQDDNGEQHRLFTFNELIAPKACLERLSMRLMAPADFQELAAVALMVDGKVSGNVFRQIFSLEPKFQHILWLDANREDIVCDRASYAHALHVYDDRIIDDASHLDCRHRAIVVYDPALPINC